MATTDLVAQYDEAFVDNIYDHLPENITQEISKSAFMNLAKNGFLQRDRLIEFAMAHASDGMYGVTSEDKRDHSDDTDTKSVTVNYRANQSNVIVSNISNKVGPLRIIAYDPATKSFRYYFIFNYDRVRSYDRIEFNIHSNSKYNNGRCGYELSSFKELATTENKFQNNA
jgi:hypothetical protein